VASGVGRDTLGRVARGGASGRMVRWGRGGECGVDDGWAREKR